MVSRSRPRFRWWLSGSIFGVVASCAPVVFVASGLVAGPDWTGRSGFLDLFAIPIACLGLLLCAVAPLFLPVSMRDRVLLVVASLIACGFLGALAALACLLRFGVPIR